LRGRSLGQLALLGQPADRRVELRTTPEARFPLQLETAIATAARDLTAIRAALPPDAGEVAERSPAELRDQLLRATSVWWRGNGAAEAGALVADVQRAVDSSFGTVEVAASSVTLTSDTGQVPITLQRRRGGPVLVQVEVASQGRLLFPDGHRSEEILLEEEGTQTVAFAVRALSTGSFPVTVRVTDPSGTRELARTVLPVRSTSLSGPALAATGLVVVVLLLLGAVRRRRPRPPDGLVLVSDEAAEGRRTAAAAAGPRDRTVGAPSAPRSSGAGRGRPSSDHPGDAS
jgi:hypothetical protein